MNNNFAGVVTRFVALLIDNIALWAISVVIMVVFGGFVGITSAGDNWFFGLLAGAAAIFSIAILFLLQFLYFGWYWSQDGQSIGMKMVNVRVVRRDSEAKVSFLRGALRGTLGYYISGLIFGLGFIWALFDANKETWHDKLFDTWVVKG